MTRRVNQVLWAQWRERLERQRKSGLSIAEFCRREGLSAVTFQTWRRKLQGESPDRSSATGGAVGVRGGKVSDTIAPRRSPRPARDAATATAGRANFLELPVVGTRSGTWIELTLVDGTIVRIPQQNLAALQTVFTILRGGAMASLAGEVSHA